MNMQKPGHRTVSRTHSSFLDKGSGRQAVLGKVMEAVVLGNEEAVEDEEIIETGA